MVAEVLHAQSLEDLLELVQPSVRLVRQVYTRYLTKRLQELDDL